MLKYVVTIAVELAQCISILGLVDLCHDRCYRDSSWPWRIGSWL